MTKFLPNGQAIKKEVRRIFNDETGRRVAVVAFVGQNALAYLPRPKGIHLVCWPHAPGTNPKSVMELIKRKVRVEFAERLHMKVYWTESHGAVVASANLSTNAYGAGGLHEAGVLIPSSKIDVDAILKSIKPKSVTNGALKKLKKAWAAAMSRSRSSGTRPAKTFLDWLAQPNPKWLLHCFDGYGGASSKRLRAVAKEETGSSRVVDWIYCRKGELQSEDFALCVDLKSRMKPIASKWIFTHRTVLVSKNDRNYEERWPYQAGQLYSSRACPPLPFDIDRPFRKAIRAAYKELQGSDDQFSIDRTAAPSKKLLSCIEKHYIEFATRE